MRRVRLTWTIGGIGLVLSGAIGMLQYLRLDIGSALPVILDVVFAAAVILFAIGLSKDASVVARRPLGVIALIIVALWPCVVRLTSPLLPQPDRQTEDLVTAYFFASYLISYAAALTAAIQIARAGTVPTRWRWAPLGAVIVSLAILVVLMMRGPFILTLLDLLVRTSGLGIVALVLASRLHPRWSPPDSPDVAEHHSPPGSGF